MQMNLITNDYVTLENTDHKRGFGIGEFCHVRTYIVRLLKVEVQCIVRTSELGENCDVGELVIEYVVLHGRGGAKC